MGTKAANESAFLRDVVYETAIKATRREERKRIMLAIETYRLELQKAYFGGDGIVDKSIVILELLNSLRADVEERDERLDVDVMRGRKLREIRERRFRADAEAMKLHFPAELDAKWDDVDTLLEMLGIQFSDPIV